MPVCVLLEQANRQLYFTSHNSIIMQTDCLLNVKYSSPSKVVQKMAIGHSWVKKIATILLSTSLRTDFSELFHQQTRQQITNSNH